MAVTAINIIYVILILISLPFGCNTTGLLKVGALPLLDSLPLSLAQHKPIFTENHLVVETVYFESPSDSRDALIEGKVDAVITDLIGALLLNDRQERVKVVRVALRASSSRPMFAIMTTPHHPITTVHGLENARIAISREATDKYVADKLLSTAGVNRWTETEVNSAQTGLEMLQRGEVTAALLSEPFISIAQRFGARVVLDDRRLLLGQTVVVFNQYAVDAKPAIIRRFLRAYEQSVRELNVRPHQYHSLVMELVRAPSEVIASLSIPLFPFPGEIPTESDVESVNTWLLAKKIVLQPVPYRRTVNAGFLWDPYQFKPAACCGW
jgi:NitT/TauT family transport system substrate-binding protein